MITLLAIAASWAGPVPMFGGSTSVSIQTSTPTSLGPTGPQAGSRSVFPVVIAPPRTDRPTPPPSRSLVLDTTPDPVRPPALPWRAAEPHKRQVRAPGQLTPIGELPVAWQPIQQAPNLLPVVQIRPR